MDGVRDGSPNEADVEAGVAIRSAPSRDPNAGAGSSGDPKDEMTDWARIMWGFVTKYYLCSRLVTFFFLFQMVVFMGFMIVGATLNFLVSTTYVMTTVKKWVWATFISGALGLCVYIFPVFCWFSFKLIKNEAKYLGKIKKQMPPLIITCCQRESQQSGGDGQPNGGQKKNKRNVQNMTLSVDTWVLGGLCLLALLGFLALAIVYVIYSSENNGKTGMGIMVGFLLLFFLNEVLFGLVFKKFYFMTKSIGLIILPTVIALIATLSKAPYVFLNNFCLYFIGFSSLFFLISFLLKSFPCFLWTLVKIISKCLGCLAGKCEITFTEKDFGSSLIWKKDNTSEKDKVKQITITVIATGTCVLFFGTIVAIQCLKPWEDSDMTFYIILSVIWLVHMIFYWICFGITYDKQEFFEFDEMSSSEEHDPEQSQDGQPEDGGGDQQDPTTKEQVLECLRFHFRNKRVHSMLCEIITNFVVIAVACIVVVIFVCGSTEFQQFKQNENVQLAKSVNVQKRNSLFRVEVCWPDMFGMSWLDYAYISRIAYQNSSLDLSKMEKLFTDRGFTITINSEIIHYAILHHELTNLTIISFRGTNSKFDAIHDAKILIEAVIPNLAVPFFPIPFQTKEWIGRMFSYTGSRAWSAGPLSLVKNGNEVVKSLVERYGADNVVVTGHSLGGGLAYIIGTTNNLTNYGVSPPGSGIGKFMNKYTQEQVVKYVHALVPQRDPVAVLGSQQGNVVHIPCREPESLSCHSLDATICMLSSICGDKYLADSCAPYWEKWQNAPKDDSSLQ